MSDYNFVIKFRVWEVNLTKISHEYINMYISREIRVSPESNVWFYFKIINYLFLLLFSLPIHFILLMKNNEQYVFLFLIICSSNDVLYIYIIHPCCDTKAQMTAMRRLSELSKLITLGNYNSGPEALLMYRFCRDFLSRGFELPRFQR